MIKLKTLGEKLTWVSEETIWSLEMLTAALASFGGVKRARSEMVVEVGNDMLMLWRRLNRGLEKVVEGVGREGLVVDEAIAVISNAIVLVDE